MGVRSHWDTKRPTQTKVSYLQSAVLVNQKVLRLKVAVEHPSLVAEEHPFHQLIQVALSNGREKCQYTCGYTQMDERTDGRTHTHTLTSNGSILVSRGKLSKYFLRSMFINSKTK